MSIDASVQKQIYEKTQNQQIAKVVFWAMGSYLGGALAGKKKNPTHDKIRFLDENYPFAVWYFSP